jgi:hypothetical protein
VNHWILEMRRVKEGTGKVEYHSPEATEAIGSYRAAMVNLSAPKSSGGNLRVSPTTPAICALAAARKSLRHGLPSLLSGASDVSLLLIALAGLLFKVNMLRYHHTTGVCDLAYCPTVYFTPSLRTFSLAAGGSFWMIWQLPC